VTTTTAIPVAFCRLVLARIWGQSSSLVFFRFLSDLHTASPQDRAESVILVGHPALQHHRPGRRAHPLVVKPVVVSKIAESHMFQSFLP